MRDAKTDVLTFTYTHPCIFKSTLSRKLGKTRVQVNRMTGMPVYARMAPVTPAEWLIEQFETSPPYGKHHFWTCSEECTEHAGPAAIRPIFQLIDDLESHFSDDSCVICNDRNIWTDLLTEVRHTEVRHRLLVYPYGSNSGPARTDWLPGLPPV